MESREYFEMQDYNQNRNGRSLRKYSCVPLVASEQVRAVKMKQWTTTGSWSSRKPIRLVSR